MKRILLFMSIWGLVIGSILIASYLDRCDREELAKAQQNLSAQRQISFQRWVVELDGRLYTITSIDDGPSLKIFHAAKQPTLEEDVNDAP